MCRSQPAPRTCSPPPTRSSIRSIIAAPESSCAWCRASAPTASCGSKSSRRSARSPLPPPGSQNLTPTISQRKVKSSVQVASGQTVLLAGLIQEQKNVNHNGIPLFDQLPAIGNIVGNTGHNITRTELIMFIRPQVIRDSIDAGQVAEELRTKLKGTLAPVPPYVGPAPRVR